MFRLGNAAVAATRALTRNATTSVAKIMRNQTQLNAKTFTPALTQIQIRAFSDEAKTKDSSFWSDILRGKKAEEKANTQQQQAEQTQQQTQKAEQQKPEQKAEQKSEQTTQQQNGGSADAKANTTAQQPAAEEAKGIDPAAHESLKAELAASQKEVTRLQTSVTERDNKIKELRDSLLRELAEQENVRARAAKDVQAARAYGVSSFAKNLLDVVDTLDMALSAANKSLETDTNNESLKQLAEGVEMTRKVFFKGLDAAGVKKYESMGQKVDPNLHFIAAQIPVPDAEPGTVAYVIKEGYMIQDRVLRPAQVAVAAKPN